MATDSDKDYQDLVKRLRAPSTVRQAFTDVIARYSEPLYWQIRRMVQSHDDANDLLQNTFIKAWSAIDNFRGEAKLGTWLHKIAINESLSFLERERQRLNVSIDDEASMLVNSIEADEWIDGDELKLQLRKAIASLPEKQRLVFNMKYYDDMKYEEISEILGTSVGALKASYHIAVKKIEQFFTDNN
ncbi:MAG: sigma-70 family RNA polymerase sigma factor [Muribaculaceae bacterium]|nr:sigma-70 family RNA polymerase sigma factor [Muribaculaceae bacterium]